MDKYWDIAIEYLGKVNNWIPLVSVLFAGAGLIGLTLILAFAGCIARKRLVPNWLIWTYFVFAFVVIVSHIGNNLAGIVEAMEIPLIVVVVCYILRALFYRRPRYVYVSEANYKRELAKGHVYRVKANEAVAKKTVVEENEVDEEDEDSGVEIKEERLTKAEKKAQKKAEKQAKREARENQELKVEQEKNNTDVTSLDVEDVNQKAVEEEAAREAELREIEKAEHEAEKARLAAAEQAAREAHEAEKAAQEAELAAVREAEEKTARAVRSEPTPVASNRIDKTDFFTAQTATRPAMTNPVSTVDLPTVNPIPGKSYEATREPTIVARPVSQTMPDLKMPKTPVQFRSGSYASSINRPAPRPATTSPIRTASTSPLINRPSTLTRPTSATSVTGNNSAFGSSMYNSRVRTTPVTTVNTNSQTPRSTEDVMAAIERLRASMKK